MTPIDPKQLAGWFEGLAPRLVLYARQWLDGGAAEDVVQETFARLMVQPAAPDSPKGCRIGGHNTYL